MKLDKTTILAGASIIFAGSLVAMAGVYMAQSSSWTDDAKLMEDEIAAKRAEITQLKEEVTQHEEDMATAIANAEAADAALLAEGQENYSKMMEDKQAIENLLRPALTKYYTDPREEGDHRNQFYENVKSKLGLSDDHSFVKNLKNTLRMDRDYDPAYWGFGYTKSDIALLQINDDGSRVYYVSSAFVTVALYYEDTPWTWNGSYNPDFCWRIGSMWSVKDGVPTLMNGYTEQVSGVFAETFSNNRF